MKFFLKNLVLFFQMIRKPVFLIPGLGGSNLYHKDTKKEIWPPSFSSLFFPEEFISNFRVSYINNEFKSDIPTITGPIGTCESIRIMKSWTIPFFRHDYFQTLINSIHKIHDIYCFPYDFRIIGNKNYRTLLNKKLKESIEEKKEKVVLISHSFGGIFLHQFLLEQTIEWKNKYIDKFITINSPYGGSVHCLNLILKNVIEKPILNNIDYIENLSPFLWLIPNPYIEERELLFENDTMKVYNHNISVLLDDNIWERIQYHFRELQENIKKDVDVPTYIIYSTNTLTRQYCTSSKNQSISLDGDGILTTSSLTLPKNYWKNQSFLHFIEIPNEEHTQILKSPKLLNILKKLITL